MQSHKENCCRGISTRLATVCGSIVSVGVHLETGRRRLHSHTVRDYHKVHLDKSVRYVEMSVPN